jgi:outer membrane immunogenic protein
MSAVGVKRISSHEMGSREYVSSCDREPEPAKSVAIGRSRRALFHFIVLKRQHPPGRLHVRLSMFSGAVMKKLTCVVALTGLIGTSALAADMAVKPPPPVAPVSSWTGFYVGGNIGYGWGNNADPAFSFTDNPLLGFTAFAAEDGFQFPSLQPSGVVGGGQIGYDWQFGNWLLGAVADFQGSGMKASASPTIVVLNPFNEGLSAQENWVGTVRARLGAAALSNWLFYATGGLAYGQVKSTLDFVGPHGSPPYDFIGSQTSTGIGWAAGAGVEYKLAANWSVGVEYLYFNLGDHTVTGTGYALATEAPLFPGASLSVTQLLSGNIVRGMINYRF